MIMPVSSTGNSGHTGTYTYITLPRAIVPEDTFRILVATDNHIGYNERDPVRGQDSINTFREILQLAVKNDVSVEWNLPFSLSSPRR